MKTLFRVLVILVAASLVGGAIFALVNGNGATARQSSFQQAGGDHPRPEGGERDRSNGVLFLPFGMVKNLAVISIIAAIYLNAGRLFGKPLRPPPLK